MGKKLPSQPDDTTKTGGSTSGGYMKGKDVHPGAKPRQDGKGSKKGGVSKDGLWEHGDSVSQGPIEA